MRGHLENSRNASLPSSDGHCGEAWVGQSLKRPPHFLQAFHSHIWKPLRARPWVGARELGARQIWLCSQEAGDPGGRSRPGRPALGALSGVGTEPREDRFQSRPDT